ncbi:MAG: TRAP transporter substrate-binding protein [Betaproteobacteria bacterium]|nr:TRAP transporter substrate-binding protein [Betaproteobacteria bacterium]
MTKSIRMFVSAVAVAVAAHPAIAQEKIELKASTFVPPGHFFVADFLTPWAAEMAKRTNGTVTVRTFAGNSPFGNVANQSDQVAAGVMDIALAQNGFPRGRMPRALLMELPQMASGSEAASKALWSMRDSHLAAETKGFKLLGMMCGTAIGFFTRDKKVERMEDLKGLRIRVTNAQSQAVLQHLGGVPVTLPVPQIYESLEKGIIDGAIMGYDGVMAFKVENLVRYHYTAQMFVTCFHVVMNQKKYDELPAIAKKAIDDTTGDPWVAAFAASWNKSEQAGRVAGMAKGIIESPVSPEQRAKWREQFKPVVDQQIAETEKQGVPNARAIYDEMLKRTAQFAR